MKWTDEQIAKLREMAYAEKSNAEIAATLHKTLSEVYAKRSQLGITIPKVNAAKESKGTLKVSRAEFLSRLEGLLVRADLNVERLQYVYDPVSHDCIDIIFCNGAQRRVCIEADSRAAIIKDVLRGCE